MNFVDVKTPFRWGMMSLIGTSRERPVSWGNYHDILILEDNLPKGFNPKPSDDFFRDRYPEYVSFRVVNMWKENFQDAMDKFIDDAEVEMRLYSSGFCVIDDNRIPEDYYYRPMHFKYARFDQEEIKHAYDTYGDPTNEYEQFSNPRIYYARRGQVYSNGNIAMSFVPNDPIRIEAAQILKEYENNVVTSIYIDVQSPRSPQPIDLFIWITGIPG